MRVLLFHQNFPGQYKYLGPALAARGDEVVALTPKVKKTCDLEWCAHLALWHSAQQF